MVCSLQYTKGGSSFRCTHTKGNDNVQIEGENCTLKKSVRFKPAEMIWRKLLLLALESKPQSYFKVDRPHKSWMLLDRGGIKDVAKINNYSLHKNIFIAHPVSGS